MTKKEVALEGLFTDVQLDHIPTAEAISSMALRLTGSTKPFELVSGDIVHTAPEYVAKRPGFRISLLHLDLDVAEPTLAALEAFYPVVTPGGVIVFDEYAVPKWSESDAVTKFFADKPECIKCLPWAKSPTAYCVKR